MQHRAPLLFLLLAAMAPALAMGQGFGKVVNSIDSANKATVPPASVPDGFAKVTDTRDTMPLPPPPPRLAAPIEQPIEETDAIYTPPPPTVPSPTLPPLVKRSIPQQVTEAAPGVLLVQPGNLSDARGRDAPLTTNSTITGRMFNDRTETLTPEGIVDDQPDPRGGFSFGGTPEGARLPAVESPEAPVAPAIEQPAVAMPTAPSITAPMPVIIISPATVVTPTVEASPTAAVSATVPQGPMAAGLTFTNDDTDLSPKAKKQLDTFSRLAGGVPLASLSLTQRTVGPVNALNELADARRANILKALRAAHVVNDTTRIHEVRVRATTPQSKVTLVGTPSAPLE
ncbi:MAG TPA: hypothetical protein VHP58_01730 [Alphaproteobacteria bacterium]|nr:hypothetical protein [Alphaproteobacteria bacterium]